MVRAEDRAWWINLPVAQELRTRVEHTSSGGAGPMGCADASLCERFLTAGLIGVKRRPQLATFDTEGPYLETLQSQILATLTPEQGEMDDGDGTRRSRWHVLYRAALPRGRRHEAHHGLTGAGTQFHRRCSPCQPTPTTLFACGLLSDPRPSIMVTSSH